MRVPVVVSTAHVHLTSAVIEKLFGDHYRLHVQSRLGQPTQYAAQESVSLIGPHGRLSKVRIIGPPRETNQVELSQTDARTLGIQAPTRASCDLKETPGILLEGPRAQVRLEHGVIRALCHLHMSPLDADGLGLVDGDRVDIGTERHTHRILFRDVLVRVSADCRLELHLDSDESKTAGLKSGDHVIVHALTGRTLG